MMAKAKEKDDLIDEDPKPVSAEALYDAYRARKQQQTALPLPAFAQLDELERLSWEETAKVVA